MDETFRGYICHNRKLIRYHHHAFKHIFDVDLKDYFDLVTGFDIIKFDSEIIKSCDNESVQQAIYRKYGDDGVNLVKTLLGIQD